MVVNKLTRLITFLLLIGVTVAMAGCSSGSSNQSSTNGATSGLTLQNYINSLSYSPLSTSNNFKLNSKQLLLVTKLGNQQVFTALAPVTLASIDMNYYTDDHCESLASVTTIGGSATSIPAGTYSTNDVSNYNLCSAYPAGCGAELSAAQTASFKSIQYKYNYTNLASSSSVCMYNSDKGYEALANYSEPATPSACIAGSSCGYSESYGAQILGVPALSTVSSSGTNSYSCRVTGSLSNNITCWGTGSSGQIGNGQGNNALPSSVVMPNGVTSFTQFSSTGNSLSCGIASTGVVYCWGTGSSGQIGNGASISVNTPTAVTMPNDVESFTSVSSNNNFSCAIADNGKIYCWGVGTNGKIGNGDIINVNVPTSVTMPAGVESFSSVSTNSSFSCAIADNGKVYCWGSGKNGQIGNGTNVSGVNVPTSVTMPAGVASFSSISTNSNFSCAIADNGKVYCWGLGTNGRIGNGSASSVKVPTVVTMPAGVESFSSISTNSNFSCAIADNGKVYCWGVGNSGQIGNGANASTVSVPTAVTMPAEVTSFSSVSTNANFSCAITNTGKVYCWGTGSSGQIGNGASANVNVPTAITLPSGVESFSSVSTNSNFSCAIANTNTVYCWGDGKSGQIGNGGTSNINIPTSVTIPAGVESFSYVVSTSTISSCASANNNKLYCWGANTNGSLGRGDQYYNTPTNLLIPAGVSSFNQVSTAANNSCAIANTGKVYCWGDGTSGQIGNGTDASTNLPTQITMPDGVNSFSTVATTGTNTFSCALANTGNIYCWGNGTTGQIGNGASSNVNIPTATTMPSGVTSFSSVATGTNFSCALANTGNVYCWGTGDSGQIGNDASSNVNVPTAVTMPSGVTSFRSIASGVQTNCAIANTGTVYCWGFGANGEIGNGANNNVNVPTAVTMPAGVTSFSSVSINYNFSCAVANTGVVYCWGYGGYGQIGNGASVTVNVPTAVTMPAGVTNFSAAWVNAGSSCALANTGVVYCWGTGTNGQIGNGADSNVNVPTAVTMPSGVTSFGYVSTNALFSCAIAASGTNAGSTYCWGNGTSGQIGNGANNDVNVPTLVQ